MHGPPSLRNENYRELLEQLAALRLPPLEGKRFLDIACGDGFFCGYAAFNGAAQVIGIAGSETELELAKRNFPACDFRLGSWEALPDHGFDVILLASASYHTRGFGVLIQQVMEKLAVDGTLVVEIGIVDSRENVVKVRDAAADLFLLSWNTVRTVFDRYAWKSIGHRAFLPEQQIEQYVIHVRNMKPYVFLLLEPPASGKSTIQRVIFNKTGFRIVSGDQVLSDIFNGNISSSPELEDLVRRHFVSTSIAKLTKIIFAHGRGPDLIQTWCEQAKNRHFVLDSFLHKKFHPQLHTHLRAMGYVPVAVNWSMDSSLPLPKQAVAAAESYRTHLQKVFNIADPEKLPVLESRRQWPAGEDAKGRFFARLKKAIVNINR